MAKRRHTAEQIIAKLREAEILLAKGAKLPQVFRKLGVTEVTHSQCTSCHTFESGLTAEVRFDISAGSLSRSFL